MTRAHSDEVSLVVSIGDPNGIGPEVFFRAIEQIDDPTLAITLVTPGGVLRQVIDELGIDEWDLTAESLRLGAITVEVSPIPEVFSRSPGAIDPTAGRIAGIAIEQSVDRIVKGQADGLVTMPISKESLNLGGYPWPGHTEMLGHLSGQPPLMILACEKIRVALLSGHVPLHSVPNALSVDEIVEKSHAFYRALKSDFGIDEPQIAQLGLNPHAGDGGMIGREEIEIFRESRSKLRSLGIDVTEPFAADAFFARKLYGQYDGVLACYHDQGLIPMKMLADSDGVNVTAGLPFVRTSPDHGTAFDIAGKGRADPSSTVEAIRLAAELVRRRRPTGD